MFSILVGIVTIVAWLWMLRSTFLRGSKKYIAIMDKVRDAERNGDLEAAEQYLTEVEGFALSRKGFAWDTLLHTVRLRLAQLHYRRGDLDRSARMAFDTGQHLRAVT